MDTTLTSPAGNLAAIAEQPDNHLLVGQIYTAWLKLFALQHQAVQRGMLVIPANGEILIRSVDGQHTVAYEMELPYELDIPTTAGTLVGAGVLRLDGRWGGPGRG